MDIDADICLSVFTPKYWEIFAVDRGVYRTDLWRAMLNTCAPFLKRLETSKQSITDDCITNSKQDCFVSNTILLFHQLNYWNRLKCLNWMSFTFQLIFARCTTHFSIWFGMIWTPALCCDVNNCDQSLWYQFSIPHAGIYDKRCHLIWWHVGGSTKPLSDCCLQFLI